MGKMLATSMTQIGNSGANLVGLAEKHVEKKSIRGFQAKLRRDADAAYTNVQSSHDIAQS